MSGDQRHRVLHRGGRGGWRVRHRRFELFSEYSADHFEPHRPDHRRRHACCRSCIHGERCGDSARILLTVNPLNDPPTISNITAQTTDEDTPVAGVAFTVNDVETAPTNLV